MQLYLAGHKNFGNRGCEALVRSTVAMVRERVPSARFLCPSDDKNADAAQWRDAASTGIEFVPTARLISSLRWWGRLRKYTPTIGMAIRPPMWIDNSVRDLIAESDAVVMTGGDVISLDYGAVSLYHWAALAEAAADLGKPAVLWAASIGPFSSDPVIERNMMRHLSRYALITVRESETIAYLERIGIRGAVQVADPAFLLKPEKWDFNSIRPAGNADLLGFNVSPLIREFRKNSKSAELLDAETVAFLRQVLATTELSIVLTPHVDPLDGSICNSDSAYMRRLLHMLGDVRGRVILAPQTLNAAQLKFMLGCCRYFIGARTHATIGALSQGVPTISIAYSVKAVGINKDLFGDTRYVLPTPNVSAQSLSGALERLRADDNGIRSLLAERIPVWRGRARISAERLETVLTTASKSPRGALSYGTRPAIGDHG